MALISAFQNGILFFLVLQLSLAFAKPAFHHTRRSSDAIPLNPNEYQTNAQRLAVGLPPLAPKRRFTPSPVQLAARSGPSPTPFSGVIRARAFANTNTDLGWISKTTSTGKIRSTTGTGDRLPVSFTYFATDRPFEIGIPGETTQWKFLGAAGAILAGNTSNNLVKTNSVPSNSGPQSKGNSAGSGLSESYIWTFNPTTNEFSGIWSNGQDNNVPVYFYISNGSGLKFFSLSASPNLGSAEGVTRIRLTLEV